MADQWYKFGDGFLLVYSITDRPTFESIQSFHQDILRATDRSYVPCVMVSNKVSCSNHLPTPLEILILITVRSGDIASDQSARRSESGQESLYPFYRVFSGRWGECGYSVPGIGQVGEKRQSCQYKHSTALALDSAELIAEIGSCCSEDTWRTITVVLRPQRHIR